MSFKCVIVLLLALAVPALSQTVRYEADVFPEDAGQGWVRTEQVFPSDRSLDDGWFVQSPVLLPCPPECTTQGFYRRELIDHAGLASWVLSWRMATDGPLAPGAVAPSGIVAGGTTGIRYHFTIGEDELIFNRGSQFPLVFAQFAPGPHTFNVELRNTGETGTYSFTLDGEVIDAGVAEGYYPTEDSVIVFGARAAIEDSITRWDWIEFGDPTAPIPAVSHWGIAVLALLVATAGTLVFRHQRRRAPLPQGR